MEKKINNSLFIFALLFISAYTTPVVKPIIIRTFAHSRRSFTQGLIYYNEKLFESTGAAENRMSQINIIDPISAQVIKQMDIPDCFAEGLTFFCEALFLLTWQKGELYILDTDNLDMRGTMLYNGEGWGLTTDGMQFIMSNGSDTLTYRDASFSITDNLVVTDDGKPLRRLNELEYVNGMIYANVWYSTNIYVINPKSGNVIKIVDCNKIIEQSGTNNPNAVLNGIAYNPKNKTFYLTGKDWAKFFEVRIP